MKSSSYFVEESTSSPGVDLALADLRQPVVEMARRMGFLEVLGEDRIFPTVGAAVQALGE